MRDKISLEGISLRGRHGVLPEEKKLGQTFILDIDLYGDFEEAAKHDDLTRSVDYSKIFELVKNTVEGKSFNLIEALAHRICEMILKEFNRVEEVMVRIRKPQVPLPGILDAAAVELTRGRG